MGGMQPYVNSYGNRHSLVEDVVSRASGFTACLPTTLIMLRRLRPRQSEGDTPEQYGSKRRGGGGTYSSVG